MVGEVVAGAAFHGQAAVGEEVQWRWWMLGEAVAAGYQGQAAVGEELGSLALDTGKAASIC